MYLSIQQTLDREICHYADTDLLITSRYNRVYWQKGGREQCIQLPGDGWKGIISSSRLIRRALRLDKCNVVPTVDGLVIVRQGKVYHYDHQTQLLAHTLSMANCRNVLHQSIAVLDGKDLYFGEYGANAQRREVPVYRSQDGGKTWEIIFRFPAGKIKHVHGCYWDPHTEKIWVFTGDFAGECYLLCADKDFHQVEWIGDGDQAYRACNAFFESDSIHWIMDSQLEDSYHVVFDRKTKTIRRKSVFPGPVWYIKRLTDGYYLAATAQEIGPGVHDSFAHLLVSTDLEHWEDIHQFAHDRLPKRYFKFGVPGFADGEQSSHSFYIFGEALQGVDGKTLLCKLV